MLILDDVRFLFSALKGVREYLPTMIGGIIFLMNIHYIVVSYGREWDLNVCYYRRDYKNIKKRWYSQIIEASDWVKKNTPKNSVVVIRKPRVFSFFSERHCVRYPFTQDMRAMWRFFNKYRDVPLFVAFIGWNRHDVKLLRDFINQNIRTGHLKIVFRSYRKGFYLLKFLSFPEED